jgi:hypothetical protein
VKVQEFHNLLMRMVANPKVNLDKAEVWIEGDEMNFHVGGMTYDQRKKRIIIEKRSHGNQHTKAKEASGEKAVVVKDHEQAAIGEDPEAGE